MVRQLGRERLHRRELKGGIATASAHLLHAPTLVGFQRMPSTSLEGCLAVSCDFATSKSAEYGAEDHAHAPSALRVSTGARNSQRPDSDAEPTDLIAWLGQTAHVEKRYNAFLVKGHTEVGRFQTVGSKPDINPSRGTHGGNDRVSRILDGIVELALGVAQRVTGRRTAVF